jgi:hypothetical protein
MRVEHLSFSRIIKRFRRNFSKKAGVCTLVLLLGGATSLVVGGAATQAEPAPVHLVAQPPLGLLLASLPRLAPPSSGPAAQRINQALATSDAGLRSAVSQCRDSANGSDFFWERSVSVAMRGPTYLSLVISDNYFCGGAYPNAVRFALSYDLRTGAALNWKVLLPKTMVRSVIVNTASDGAKFGVVEAPFLKTLYMGTVTDVDCESALRAVDLRFILWLDPQREGIALQPYGLAHAVNSCGTETVVGLATLRQMHMNPSLLRSIAAAHTARLYGPSS